MKGGLHKTTFLLLVLGGINWFLVGAFEWDLGQLLGGQEAVISRALYVLVGLSAIYELVSHKQNCRVCNVDLQG
jgi:uncharacterized membrane protein YuzA (DUF378 family)